MEKVLSYKFKPEITTASAKDKALFGYTPTKYQNYSSSPIVNYVKFIHDIEKRVLNPYRMIETEYIGTKHKGFYE